MGLKKKIWWTLRSPNGELWPTFLYKKKKEVIWSVNNCLDDWEKLQKRGFTAVKATVELREVARGS